MEEYENGECDTLLMFREDKVTCHRIGVLFHAFQTNMVKFCRFYILLAFGEVYFPQLGNRVNTRHIKTLMFLSNIRFI